MDQNSTNKWIGLAAWLALCLAAGFIGSQFEPGTWYADLEKPNWTPPSWIFGPVWTLLYILMAVAAWLVWKDGGFRNATTALSLFIVQLVLNAMWSWIFFGLQRPAPAFIEILFLWAVLVATTVVFWRRRSGAGVLLLPYLAWVTFAAALNFAIWQLN